MVAMTPAWAHRSTAPTHQVGLADSRPDVDETDGALLRACRAGDGEAWDVLVERYERLVFSVALRNGLEREDAADVTQEVFVALLHALDSLKDDTALASWLMTVARRTAWRIQERNGRARRAPYNAKPLPPDDPVDAWTSLATLHDAVARLGDPCRTLIHDLYLDADPASYAEIADSDGAVDRRHRPAARPLSRTPPHHDRRRLPMTARPSFASLADYVEGRLDPEASASIEDFLAAGDPDAEATIEWLRTFRRCGRAAPARVAAGAGALLPAPPVRPARARGSAHPTAPRDAQVRQPPRPARPPASARAPSTRRRCTWRSSATPVTCSSTSARRETVTSVSTVRCCGPPDATRRSWTRR